MPQATLAQIATDTQGKNQDLWKLWHEPSRREFVVHDADTPGEKCITCRVVKNLHQHRDTLRALLAPQASSL